MEINKNNLKVFKKNIKKCVLVGSMIAVIASAPFLKTEAKAYSDDNSYTNFYESDDSYEDISSFELSEDNKTITIYYANNLSILNNFPNIVNVNIVESDITEAINLENTQIDSICFENCSIKTDVVKFPSSLTEITLNNTTVKNYNFISNNNNILSLYLTNYNAKDLSIIKNNTNLQCLGFTNSNIANIDDISNLKNLTYLSFNNTGIESLDKLDAPNLIALTATGTYIKDIDFVKKLQKLEFLNLSNSFEINNFDAITYLTNLQQFYATNCEMSYDIPLINYLEKNPNIKTNVTRDGLNVKEQIINIANSIVNNKMNDNEKIEAIVNYVLDNLKYDESIYEDEDLINYYNDKALEKSLTKTGICEQYAELTRALLKTTGIKTYNITGNNHIWNLVILNGDPYWLDTTWIDIQDINNLSESCYFMENNNDFVESHPFNTVPSSEYEAIINKKYGQNFDSLNYDNNITEIQYSKSSINGNDLKTYLKNIIVSKKTSIIAIIGILSALGIATPAIIKNKNKKLTESKNLSIKH